MPSSLLLLAPAKLNLTLEVLNRRADGLHGLRSVMVPVTLYDELQIARNDSGPRFTCDDPSLETANLVERAFAALAPADRAYDIHLRKRIPVGGGLGGGSSDAAAVLLAAQSGAFGALGERDYLRVARSLGSDVSFFLVQTGALVEGTGERVTAAGTLPSWHAVIVRPPVVVSTKEAYASLDASSRKSRARAGSASLHVLAALQRGEFDEVVASLHNDFEPVIASRAPEVATALEALREAGAQTAALTGSGSCVFALARDASQAEALCSRIALPGEFAIYRAAFASGAAWRSAA